MEVPAPPAGSRHDSVTLTTRWSAGYVVNPKQYDAFQGATVPNWTEACKADDVDEEDVFGVNLNDRRYAIYRSPDDDFYATDGYCTHEQFLLADGLVMDNIIECPKHNGRFDYTTGEGQGDPICENLRIYPVKVDDGVVFIDLG